jgi:phosphoribosylaminoimidazole (AIR) synthetase
VFRWIAGAGQVTQNEMLRTFNCGVGMVAVVTAGHEADVIARLNEEGETAQVIGMIEPRGHGDAVRFAGKLDLAA